LLAIVFFAYRLFMWPRSKVFGYYPYQAKTRDRVLALSFDDGPNPPFTEQLLAVLAKHEVKATFFIIGQNLEKFPETARAIVAAGHTLGNHAYNHNLSAYLKDLSLKAEIIKTQDLIRKFTGKKPALFRSPWLIRSPKLFRELKTLGLTPISGIFGTQKELYKPSAQLIYRDALRKIKPGRILVFHDGFGLKTADRSRLPLAIDRLLGDLKARGYSFLTVDSLLGLKPYQD